MPKEKSGQWLLRKIGTINHGDKWATAAALTSDDQEAMLVGNTGILKTWEIATGKLLREHRGAIGGAKALSASGRLWADQPNDQSIAIWKSPDHSLTFDIQISENDRVAGMVFDHQEQRLAFTDDHGLEVWDISAKQRIVRIDGFFGSRLAFSPDGKMMVVSSSGQIASACGGSVSLVEVPSGQVLAEVQLTKREAVSSLACSLDGKFIAASCGDLSIWLLEADSLKEVAKRKTTDKNGGYIRSLCFVPGGPLIGGSNYGHLLSFDARSLKLLGRVIGHPCSDPSEDTYIHAVLASSDGCRLFSASDDGTLAIWSTK